jgi:aspartate/tyrosine/aromatic aminotransferase
MSRFSVVSSAPPVEIFALSKAFKEDTFGQKVDLGIGGEDNHSYYSYLIMISIDLMKY